MLKLIPVVEFEPSFFQLQEREMPDEFHKWDNWWKDSIADSGITGLNPYPIGCWSTEITKLTPGIIEIFLNKIYDINNAIKIDLEEIGMGSLRGGYVLEVSDTVRIKPECCGDLGAIKEWDAASDWTNAKEMTLWIGHPWLEVSSIDDRYLKIRRTAEYGEPEEPVIITVNRTELKAAIIDAKKQLDNFKQLLFIALPSIFPHLLNDSPSPTATEIAELLIYGW
jgi:hypothetical protein